jgi:probable O-glycosylation ligase (exosortase A-associated)
MKGLIFTLLMTYCGAAVALFNPFIGLLVYVCFAIIRPDFMWPWAVPPGNYSRTIAIALMVGWVLKGFGKGSAGRGRAVVGILIAFLVWSCLCALRAGDQQEAWTFVEILSKIVLPVVVGITLIDSTRKLLQLAWVILLSYAYAAFEFNLSYFEGTNRLRFQGFAAMDNNCIAIGLVTCVGLAIFLGLESRKYWVKAVALVSGLLIIHAVLFSNSRGGMIALIISGSVAFVLIPKRPAHYLTFLAIVLVTIRLAGPEVIKRFETAFASDEQRDGSAKGRLRYWGFCWDMMKKNPIFGVGPNQFPIVATTAYGEEEGREAHSLWLQTGAELGFPGVFLLASFYGTCVVRLWPMTRSRAFVSDPWHGVLARMTVTSLVGFAVSAQFVSLEALETPYYIALIGAGVLKLSTPSLGGTRPKGRTDQYQTNPIAG